MPLLRNDNYQPPLPLKNKHLNTITPTLFRKVSGVYYKRYRINTSDNDFIDYDVSTVGSNSAVIILHGLEGNSHKAYVKGIVKEVNAMGLDAIAINQRGCSEEDNLLLSSYHIGKTDDLGLVIDYAISQFKYKKLHLLGFSMGGNMVLKYAGENDGVNSEKVISVTAISVPCHLKSAAYQLSKWSNKLYLFRFLRTLKQKALLKIEKHHEKSLSITKIKAAKSFYEFDNIFTAPVHGFKNAEDYWEKSSSLNYLVNINVPTLIINALDDPFLPPECYPNKIAAHKSNIYLRTPKFGGHVGFMTNLHFEKKLWHEVQTVNFLSEHL
jgi:uncharacterized protein